MIVIGERLNSSRRAVLDALQSRDEAYLIREARAQRDAGAAYIDLNAAAIVGQEVEVLTWAVPLLQRELGVSLAIDTPNDEAMVAAIRLHEGQAVLNSLTGERARLEKLLPVVKEHKPKVIALCLDDRGMPRTADQALAVAESMVETLGNAGVKMQDIFVDPLVRPVGVDEGAARLFLDSLAAIKKRLPDAQTIAGVSNVSFGLPLRRLLNRTLLVLALEKGLDAAILDPLDTELTGALAAARVLLGQDAGCRNYLGLARGAKPRM